MRFRDCLGASVYHCRILAHEDAGMMAVVEVTRTSRGLSTRTLEPLARNAAHDELWVITDGKTSAACRRARREAPAL
jgi:hypothetical protein